ncbi:thiopeptide-type bacteriocin biosynthesis protein [Yinghuangia sp. YIM S10712]|uniref:thiopeptide-type bacteriocin biosynthesis protein n=1 Tax=Yinghuangia sp. YIM S10712 TaxID=3436930 RepID=UPI003F529BCA
MGALSGKSWAPHEQVLTADSEALLAQLRRNQHGDRRAVASAHLFALAAAFTGTPHAGADWLVSRLPARSGEPLPRHVLNQARELADPANGFAALLGGVSNAALAHAWTDRDAAVRRYRDHFPGAHTYGIDPDAVLDGLMHAHVLRACGTDKRDKAACLQLARAAALTHVVRTGQEGPHP